MYSLVRVAVNPTVTLGLPQAQTPLAVASTSMRNPCIAIAAAAVADPVFFMKDLRPSEAFHKFGAAAGSDWQLQSA